MILQIQNAVRDLQMPPGTVVAQLALRSAGENTYVDAKKRTHIRRRFMLLGATVDSARVWDIVRAIETIRASKEFGKLPIRVEADGHTAVNALYASLFVPVDELVLTNLPKSHVEGPDYLNVLRILDIPQALAMASERCRVALHGANERDWQFAKETARVGGFEQNLLIQK
jgi:hypothetical protein